MPSVSVEWMKIRDKCVATMMCFSPHPRLDCFHPGSSISQQAEYREKDKTDFTIRNRSLSRSLQNFFRFAGGSLPTRGPAGGAFESVLHRLSYQASGSSNVNSVSSASFVRHKVFTSGWSDRLELHRSKELLIALSPPHRGRSSRCGFQ